MPPTKSVRIFDIISWTRNVGAKVLCNASNLGSISAPTTPPLVPMYSGKTTRFRLNGRLLAQTCERWPFFSPSSGSLANYCPRRIAAAAASSCMSVWCGVVDVQIKLSVLWVRGGFLLLLLLLISYGECLIIVFCGCFLGARVMIYELFGN